ncbi:hypothetical protein ACSW9V_15420 (plasmid) [Clostridium perfringens]|uniref:hypothetical protein n=1 Tax=Clostridium perfringens TaxID=1502 RepID=UPI000B387D3A|nr:hypothetical protein [Clostridium perfringens]EGT0690321.1 hypothetical protein [Clostridium perfringens]EGT0693482.1 hypothetical protein [Clostridium perfringens]EGT0696447.1 hypothetical protein [Clostridium perfringens]MDU3376276.1 hypothetical protein [Clostridium perfringens]MDU3534233.1 hypothetical protein [Clostridium perfringens]
MDDKELKKLDKKITDEINEITRKRKERLIYGMLIAAITIFLVTSIHMGLLQLTHNSVTYEKIAAYISSGVLILIAIHGLFIAIKGIKKEKELEQELIEEIGLENFLKCKKREERLLKALNNGKTSSFSKRYVISILINILAIVVAITVIYMATLL